MVGRARNKEARTQMHRGLLYMLLAVIIDYFAAGYKPVTTKHKRFSIDYDTISIIYQARTMLYQFLRDGYPFKCPGISVGEDRADPGMPVPNRAPYRNFHRCPHCIRKGQEGDLVRLSEGFPMLSRSDGFAFHFFLADCPKPFPKNGNSNGTPWVQACFCYEFDPAGCGVQYVTAFLDESKRNDSLFRRIEDIVDLLSCELATYGELANTYDFRIGAGTIQSHHSRCSISHVVAGYPPRLLFFTPKWSISCRNCSRNQHCEQVGYP